MLRWRFLLFPITLMMGQLACQKAAPVAVDEFALMAGEVYAVGGPAMTVPPPLYQNTSTIVVLDSTKKTVNEFLTNAHGQFQFQLLPGSYYLQVKESPLADVTGPFEVVTGRVDSAFAYYDNGLR